MRALRLMAPRKLELVDVPRPAIGDGEVLVRCTHVALCGSGMWPYRGDGFWAETDYPKTPGFDGHENLGVVEESRAPGWEPGTPVLAHPEDYCGLADFIRCLPDGLARLPADHPDPASLVVAQPLATVLRAMAKTGPVVHQTCAVVGQGPMGLIFTHLLGRMGAKRVIAIEPSAWRREQASLLGATDVLDAAGNLPDAVKELTSGEMVDFVVEAVGTPDALATASMLPKRYGRLMVFGVPSEHQQMFPWHDVFRREVQIVTSVGAECKAFFQTAVDMCVEGRVDLGPMVTPRMPFERAPEAFDLYADRADGCLKLTLEL